jgi:transposase-like protein
MAAHRKYLPECKREAVEMTSIAGITAGQVAQEMGINGNMLERWKSQVAASGPQAFKGQGRSIDQEFAALKRELSRV